MYTYLVLISLILRNEAANVKIEQSPCPKIQDSIQSVPRCPQDESEWHKAAKRKNCSTTGCSKELVYHCVPDHYQKITVEVCAPVKFIVFGYCVEYSFLGRRVQANHSTNCKQFAVPCPIYYKSNEVYKHQGCYKRNGSSHFKHRNEYKNSQEVPNLNNNIDEANGGSQRSKTNLYIFMTTIVPVGIALAGIV